MKKYMLGLLLLIGAGPFLAQAEDSAFKAKGSVLQMGYGKIVLGEADELTRTFLEGRRDTSYLPANWRPEVGDEIEITFVPREQKLVATLVSLTKIGPNNIDPAKLKSPLLVTVTEVGRSGVIGTAEGIVKPLRFATGRGTKYEPVGWKPVVGERVRVAFDSRSNPITFNVSFVAESIIRAK